MKKENLFIKSIPWIKRVLGVSTVIIWIAVIMKIASSPAPFAEEAPYCIVSTMIIFGLLTAAFKGLELIEKKNPEYDNKKTDGKV